MSAAIDVIALTKTFGEFTAVDNVTFDVPAGTIFGFLGPNGAGKTTTIKMLTGLLRPTAGVARVAGLDTVKSGRELRATIGYMSQRFSLYPDLTADENIALYGGLYGVTGARFNERRAAVLDLAGIRGSETQLTANLPLGWKQRLALGCAVLHEPRILFLDEPTSGVDPIARRAFWDLIADLAAGGTTVLVSTHYMEEAEYCDRLILMNRGRLIAAGTPAGLRAEMTEPIYTIAVDHAPAAVEALQHTEGVLEAAMFGRDLHVVAADAAQAERVVPAALAAAGHAVRSMTRGQPSLEDVFVSLVRREGGAVTG